MSEKSELYSTSDQNNTQNDNVEQNKPSNIRNSTDTPSSPRHHSPSHENDTGKGGSPDRPDSPENSCSICLCKLENKSFTDSCFHTFCFTCLLEWSKVKAVCPLCKQPFKSIIHNVRSNEDYDQYEIRHSETHARIPEELNTGGRFRYRTTLTNERWMIRQNREQSRQRCLLQRPTSSTVRSDLHGLRPVVSLSTSEFRRRVYENGMRVREPTPVPGRPIRQRNIRPDFFRANPACTHRLVPWLNRELNVLLSNAEDRVQLVLELIMDIIQRFEIGGEIFRTHLESFLGRRTDHFVHEFLHYARSPYDMSSYDKHALYDADPELFDPDTVMVLESSSGSDDEIGDNNNNEDPDIIMLSPRIPLNSGASEDHSYFYRTPDVVEPPAVRTGLSDHMYTTPFIERDSTLPADTNNADPGHSGWESPVPGPSTSNWSPPHPRSPTDNSNSTNKDKQNTEESIKSIDPTSENLSQKENSDSEDDCLVVGYEKPLEERTPEVQDISSGEDDDLLAALEASRIAQKEEKKKLEEEERKRKETIKKKQEELRRLEEERRKKKRSHSRDRHRRSSRSRSRSRSGSRSHHRSSRYRHDSRDRQHSDRHRSRSRDRYHRSRSRSPRRYQRRSRSRDRRDRHRSRSRSRDSYRYSRYSRYDGRSRSRSRHRSRSAQRHGTSSRHRRGRSGSSGIEVIGEKSGDRYRDRGDRRDNRRGRRSVSRDSIQEIDSRYSQRRKSKSREQDKNDTSGKSKDKKAPSTQGKSNAIEMPVLLSQIKLEPTDCKKHPTGHKGTANTNSIASSSGTVTDPTNSSAKSNTSGNPSQSNKETREMSQRDNSNMEDERERNKHHEKNSDNSKKSSDGSSSKRSKKDNESNKASKSSHSPQREKSYNKSDSRPGDVNYNQPTSHTDKAKEKRKDKCDKAKDKCDKTDKGREPERDIRVRKEKRLRRSSSSSSSSSDSDNSQSRYRSHYKQKHTSHSSKSYSRDIHRSSYKDKPHRQKDLHSRKDRDYYYHTGRYSERNESEKSHSRPDKVAPASRGSGDKSSSVSSKTTKRPTTAGLAAELRKAAMQAASASQQGTNKRGTKVDLDSLEKSLREKLTKRLHENLSKKGTEK